ncbi:glycosyltransferase family 32 protein [Xenorhabdus bovienii]|uniref:Putative mannosyltransferase involved in polysaccharide biosynthesis n=1 Tax=Xenorhabdus bovienii str. Intermedium TaxID=1379677 RepID=A0A077QLS9_XENBV|nr:glycosyltransferase [Xenorhabdus bovienii]CDH34203.1 putative mannosyltransferase involved in polysaccharide biosynthesis [Xenorhabdus bovienii str. Intermedium]
MIPKKIHYVWVGDKPKPKFVSDCIETWKKSLPDYEIIEWNNDSLKNIKNNYMEEAFINKKWAFVSDYIRLYALYHEGGIYLDTDVEVTKNLDQFLHLDFFSGYEIYNGNCLPITSATIGAKRKCEIVKELLESYENVKFETKEGLDLEPNTLKITRYFSEKFGLTSPYDGSQTSNLTDNAIIYPSYYFCDPALGKENYCIHHFNGSWLPSHSRKDKLHISKLIVTRFIKIRSKGDLPVSSNENLLLNIRVSKTKNYALIFKK